MIKNTKIAENFEWVDVTAPTSEELAELVKNYQLHENSVEDCLDPEHLPKIESFDQHYFIISRYFDKESKPQADTTQELSRKVAVFVSEKHIITIQRKEAHFWPVVSNEITKAKSPWHAYVILAYAVIESYQEMIKNSILSLEDQEARVFHSNTGNKTLQNIHLIKRKHTIVKHIFSQLQTLTSKIPESKPLKSALQDLKEEQDAMVIKNSSLMEEANNLLQLYLSVNANRTNEIVRLLTVVSVFFMPLNFIAGVYGMNIVSLPFSQHPDAFKIACGFFLIVGLSVYLWFKANKLTK